MSLVSVNIDPLNLVQQPVVLERQGQPIAVLVSPDQYRRFLAWEKERAAKRAWVSKRDPRRQKSDQEWHAHFAGMDRFATHFQEASPEEVEADINEAIAAVRTEKPVHRSDL